MKKKKQKITVFLCLLLAGLVLTFSACGKTPESAQSGGNETSTSVSSSSEAQSNIQSGGKTQHIKKGLDTNLTVDADVILPSKSAYSTYSMGYQSFSPKELTTIFPAGDPGKVIVDTTTGGGLYITIADDGSILANRATTSFVANKRASAINSLVAEFGGSLEKTPSLSKELSFMTRTDAIKKGTGFLQALKLPCEPTMEPMIAAITGKELNEYQERLLKNSGYKDSPKTKVLKDLSEKDDVYYLQFRFMKEGLPVYSALDEPNISVRQQDAFSPFPMAAKIAITAQGLQYLDVQQSLSLNGKPSAPMPVISLEEALECLKKSQADIILTEPHIVKKIWMEYISIQNPDTKYENAAYTLTPYWCFQIDVVNGSDTNTEAERYNALTGKDLAYGG